jgi:Fe-S cluster assembly protein SufD
MNTTVTYSIYDQLVSDYATRLPQLSANDTAAQQQMREQAFDWFKQKGFPTIKHEDWKYTSLVPHLKEAFELPQADAELSSDVAAAAIKSVQIPGLDAYTVVLLNGKIVPEYSQLPADAKVQVRALAESREDAVFQQHFGQYAQSETYHMVALNTAFETDGIYIHIAKGAVLDKPLNILHVFNAEKPLLVQPRHLVVAEERAEIKILEQYFVPATSATVLTNTVTEVSVARNAIVHRHVIQNTTDNARIITHTEVAQAGESLYNDFQFSFPGAKLIRNNLNLALNAERTESHFYGLYIAGGNQLVDNHTMVDHKMPNCFSNEHYKGVMLDNATAVFNGKIFVRQDAQKTNAFQKNNNLLLSPKATINSKPQLEIFADDVKCSHGTTIGQFNKEQLFYLRSRGIGMEDAKNILVHAFAGDVSSQISIPAVKEYIDQLTEQSLDAGTVII